MSMAECLVTLREEGRIDAARAARFSREYERLHKAYGRAMGPTPARDAASRDTLAALDWQHIQQRRQTFMDIQTKLDLVEDLRKHLEGGGKAGQFAIGVLEHHEAVGGRVGMENRRGALFRLAWSRMDGFLGKYSRDLLGNVRQAAELRDVVRALRGEKVDSESARETAAAVADTLEWLRVQYNQAGGAIARLADWGLPQSHDALSVGQAGLDAWRGFVKTLLKPESMIDNTTGRAFVSEDALDEALEAAWRNISSEGMDGQTPGAFSGSGKLANRRSDHRFLVFRDADAWLEYNDRFGSGDVFNAIVGHIDSMTRDIAAMQTLGPNPALTVRWLKDLLHQDALPGKAGGKGARLDAKARKGAAVMERMWDYYSGAMTAVAPENRAMARTFSGIRNFNVATKLGSAFVSALGTDPLFLGMTAKFNGLPVMDGVGNWLKGLNPLDPGHRALMEHAGLVFDEMTSRGAQMWREGRGLNVHELTRRGADGVLRATLLSPHTVSGKQALGLSFMKDWADNADAGFGDLAAPKRMALERYGIDARDWDRLREVGAFDQGPFQMLRPGDLARTGKQADLDSAIKFMALIDSETRFGTPGESLRAQTAVETLGGGARFARGTLGGELLRSGNQFKTYSVIVLQTHLMRALYGRGGISRAGYALTLPVLLTIGGYISNTLLDMLSGKDPSPIAKPTTLFRAMVRGGGMGIMGDLLSSGLAGNRGTTGPATGFLVGPTLGAVVDPAISLTLGNIGQAASGEDTNFQAEFVRQLKQSIPGGNAWYGRLALNRLLLDRLTELADPRAEQGFRRQDRTAEAQGTQFYYGPGDDPGEARAPDLGNLFAGDDADSTQERTIQ